MTQIQSNDAFHLGLELFEKGHLVSARQSFENYVESSKDELLKLEAEYYVAICATRLFNKDGERLIAAFVENHPEHPKSQYANFELANFYYREKKYEKAAEYYSKSNLNNLSQNDKLEAHFKRGYSYFASRQFNLSIPDFNAVKRNQSPYYAAANYYAGYAEFQEGDYDQALKDLRNAESSKTYNRATPHMIIQIYYNQEDYNQAIAYGQNALGKSDVSNKSLILLYLADAYYFKEDYLNSSETFENYENAIGKINDREVLFKAGYSHMLAGKDEKAIASFKILAAEDGNKTRLASYYLGLLYAREGNLEFAKNAFEKGKRSENPKIAEGSSFHLAKVYFDLGESTNTIQALTEFKSKYPGSEHSEEVNGLLSKVYLNANYYDLAIEHIETLSVRNTEINEAYQGATFLKGVQLFNNRQFPQAVEMFNKSLEYPISENIVNQSNYWKGEAFSIGRRLEQAIESYQRVMNGKNVPNELLIETKYGLGYAYFNSKNYDLASPLFKDYLNSETKSRSEQKYNNALTRLADCYYVEKDYNNALSNYKIVITNGPDRAYGYLQSGIIYQLQNNLLQANINFDQVISKYPKSRYYDDALFEKAELSFQKGDYSVAINQFSKLINEEPGSRFIPYALQHRATANFNLQNYKNSEEDYRKFLEKFPRHSQSPNVLLGLQEVMSLLGQSTDFQNFLAEFKVQNPETQGLQGVEYQSAKDLYFNQKYNEAIVSLTNFIDNYPEDINFNEAKYYIAESNYRLELYDQALTYYNQLLNDYTFFLTNRILNRVGEIEFKSNRFENAIFFYSQLSNLPVNKKDEFNAWSGLMKSYYMINEFDSVEIYANGIIEHGAPSVDGTNLALLYLGKAAYSRGDFEKATDYFLETLNSAKDVNGAEAQYLLAEIFNLQERYSQSNESLFELHKSFSAYKIWYDRSFLLIADNFISLGEIFQAKQTLQSLIENSNLTFITEQAIARLKTIDEAKEILTPDTLQIIEIKTDTLENQNQN